MKRIALFSDESCYIQNDGNDVMTLATIYSTKTSVRTINKAIRKIKMSYNIDPDTEIKWTKISNTNLSMYKDIVKFVHLTTKSNKTRIRTLVAKNKSKLHTIDHGITYDQWYHAMYYYLFRKIITDLKTYTEFDVYIDKKDTYSQKNIVRLADYLTSFALWEKRVNANISNSKEHQLIQVADIFAGAASYKHRGLKTSSAKLEIINYIEDLFEIDFHKTTKLAEVSFSNFVWRGRNVR